MGTARSWRWERVLLLFAVLFGVAAMHAMVAPATPERSMSSTSMTFARADPVGTAEVTPGGRSIAAAPTSRPDHSPMPMPAAHELMTMCLAILAAAIALGLLVVAFLHRTRRATEPDPLPAQVVTVRPRPPPRTAVRLAQLCVLRN